MDVLLLNGQRLEAKDDHHIRRRFNIVLRTLEKYAEAPYLPSRNKGPFVFRLFLQNWEHLDLNLVLIHLGQLYKM